MNSKKSNKASSSLKVVHLINTIISSLIKNTLAALGLASLFKEKIDWNPLIEKAIEVYQSIIYPIWEFLLGWMGYDIPDYIKDILTLNVLLIIAMSSSSILGNNKTISIVGAVWSELKKVFQKVIESVKSSAKFHVKNAAITLFNAVAQLFFNLSLSLVFISLGLFLYVGVVLMFFKKVISNTNDNLEKEEALHNLRCLALSTVAIFYGFIALLGLNYALSS